MASGPAPWQELRGTQPLPDTGAPCSTLLTVSSLPLRFVSDISWDAEHVWPGSRGPVTSRPGLAGMDVPPALCPASAPPSLWAGAWGGAWGGAEAPDWSSRSPGGALGSARCNPGGRRGQVSSAFFSFN